MTKKLPLLEPGDEGWPLSKSSLLVPEEVSNLSSFESSFESDFRFSLISDFDARPFDPSSRSDTFRLVKKSLKKLLYP